MTQHKCQYCPTIVTRRRRPKNGKATCPDCRRKRQMQYVYDQRAAGKTARPKPVGRVSTPRVDQLASLYIRRDALAQLVNAKPADWRRLAREFAKINAPHSAAYCTAKAATLPKPKH